MKILQLGSSHQPQQKLPKAFGGLLSVLKHCSGSRGHGTQGLARLRGDGRSSDLGQNKGGQVASPGDVKEERGLLQSPVKSEIMLRSVPMATDSVPPLLILACSWWLLDL